MSVKMGQHESNGVTAKQYQMDEAQATELRQHAVEVSNAVEARIVGEVGAGERIRRSTQNVQIAGMGPAEYWGTQLWQVSKLFRLSWCLLSPSVKLRCISTKSSDDRYECPFVFHAMVCMRRDKPN